MKLAGFLIIFTFLGVWAQFFFPSTDFLSPGLVVMLQFGLYKPAVWAALAWMLIQEGTGGLAFGTVILSYLGLAAFFFCGGAFLKVNNVLFTAFLFLFLSIFNAWVIAALASLQDLVLAWGFSIERVVVQTGVYLGVWASTYIYFKKYLIHEPV